MRHRHATAAHLAAQDYPHPLDPETAAG
jgi:hypothetical protein